MSRSLPPAANITPAAPHRRQGAPLQGGDGNRPTVWLRQHVSAPASEVIGRAGHNVRQFGHELRQTVRLFGYVQSAAQTPVWLPGSVEHDDLITYF